MSAIPQSGDFPQADLIDRIAKALPPDVRAAYYREMMHCRSLPENDEMLRILHIMQILVFLIQQAPEVIVTERERMAQLITGLSEILEKTNRSMEEYRTQFDQRLAQLPEVISSRIQPEAIAAAIHESLRQELLRAGIPQMGQAFQAIAADLKRSMRDFQDRTQELRDSHRDAADEVRQASASMVRTHSQAVETVNQVSEHLSRKLEWPFYVLGCIAIIVVFLVGTRYQQWLDSPIEPVGGVVVQPTVPVSVPNVRQKAR